MRRVLSSAVPTAVFIYGQKNLSGLTDLCVPCRPTLVFTGTNNYDSILTG